MKNIFNTLFVFIASYSLSFSQKIEILLNQKKISDNSYSIDIYINKLIDGDLSLSALNTYLIFNKEVDIESAEFIFTSEQNDMNKPQFFISNSRIRIAQAPNQDKSKSVLLTDNIYYYGKLILNLTDKIQSPIVLSGNQSLQAIIYEEQKANPVAIAYPLDIKLNDLILGNYVNSSTKNIDNTQISISPNPTTDIIRVDISKLVNNKGDIEMQVVDAAGSVVMVRDLAKTAVSHTISLATLTPAPYFVKLTQDGKTYTKSVIKLQQ